MSLVEEYYELNEAEEVSAIWKILQIGLYGLAGIFGLGCGFVLGNLRMKFNDRCYLFTDVDFSVKDITDNSKRLYPEDQNKTNTDINWESDTWCDYCQFSMVSSFIVGIIWGTLFLMCGKGGKSLTGLPQPWRIVWPSMIFNLIYFVIILCTAISIKRGTDFFCAHNEFDKGTLPWTESCEPLKILIKKDIPMVILQLETVVKTSWGCVLSWFILFLLSFFRIVFIVDFHLYKICVFRIDDTIQNKKEEVLKITNYEEPKKLFLYFDNDFDGKFTYEEVPEELESESRKRTKADKRSMRQNISTRFPYKPNTVFYNTLDLRMLNKDKKRKKMSKVLDDTFGMSKTYLEVRLGTSVKTGSISDESPTFLDENSPQLPKEDNDDASSSSTVNAPDFNEYENDSMSDDEAPVVSFDSDPFLRFKKQI